jgi:hypothetical protein
MFRANGRGASLVCSEFWLGLQTSGLLRNRFFLQAHEPEINLVNSLDIFREYGLVGIFDDRTFVVSLFEGRNNLVQLVNLGVHDTEIANGPNFLDRQPALRDGL